MEFDRYWSIKVPLDVFNDFNGSLLDDGHALSVAELAEEAGGSENDIDTVDTALDSLLGVFHIASNVCKDLGLMGYKCLVQWSSDNCGWVQTLSPSWQMVLQSSKDWGDDTGLVSSM